MKHLYVSTDILPYELFFYNHKQTFRDDFLEGLSKGTSRRLYLKNQEGHNLAYVDLSLLWDREQLVLYHPAIRRISLAPSLSDAFMKVIPMIAQKLGLRLYKNLSDSDRPADSALMTLPENGYKRVSRGGATLLFDPKESR